MCSSDLASVQPARHGIRPAWKASRVEFISAKPAKMVVQVNFLPKLFLFLEAPDAVAPPAPGAAVVDAAQAGARPDGVTDSTEAVQSAIDGLPAGGVLRFPAGHYRTGSLRMRSDTTLHLDAGALLQAMDRHDSVRPLPASPDMIAYIQACDVTNLTIAGPGTIDANGYVVRKGWEAAEKIRKKPGRALAIAGCRSVRIRDVTVRDSYSWNVHAFLSDDLEIRNLKILSDVRLSNHDGIDIDRCNNVLVEDCFIFSEDDGLSPKARAGRAVVENLTFRNCVLWVHKANGIRVGSETDCDVMRNFLFEGIDILSAADGIRLDCVRGARMENIVFRDIRMESFLEHYDPRYERNRERSPAHPSRALYLLVGSEARGRPPGRIDGVVFENVRWDDARVPVRVEVTEPAQRRAAEAGPGSLIRNVVLRNCTRAGVPVRSAKDCGVSTNEPFVDALRFEAQPRTLADAALPATRLAGAPRAGDVCFTSRWKRENALDMACAFHATRLDWCYLEAREWRGSADPGPFVAEAHRLGLDVNAALPVTHPTADGWMRDADGKPHLPSHFIWVDASSPTNLPACVNSPAFRERYRRAAFAALDAGADTLQKDDGGQNYHAARHHGMCFCGHCREQARAAGIPLGNRAERIRFQQESTIAFYREMAAEIERHAGRRVALSVNLGQNKSRWSGDGAPVFGRFDFGISEIRRQNITAACLWDVAREARQLGKPVVFTAHEPEVTLAEQRRLIAGAYAVGLHALVPWDQFQAGTRQRFNGRPADFAPLFGLVRACAPWLDGYEEASATVPGITDDRWSEPPVAIRGGSGSLTAFARARPGDRAAPVVIHLVEWAGPQAATLALNRAAFFAGAACRAELLTPAPYTAAAHQSAEDAAEKLRAPGERRSAAQAAAYAPLVRREPLEWAGDGTLALPPVNPWAILIVTPGTP